MCDRVNPKAFINLCILHIPNAVFLDSYLIFRSSKIFLDRIEVIDRIIFIKFIPVGGINLS